LEKLYLRYGILNKIKIRGGFYMKNLKKNCVKLLLIFVYVLTVFTPYFIYAQDTPKKGDLKFDGTTAYIGAKRSHAL
jgi:hypothetical protein